MKPKGCMMPVAMDWDSPERTVIRVTFMDNWSVDDVHRMLTKRNSMMECVHHQVHQILDLTASTASPNNLLSVIGRIELPTEQKGSLVLIVNASSYIKSVAGIMQKMAPHVFKGVHFMNSVEDAYAEIAHHGDYAFA